MLCQLQETEDNAIGFNLKMITAGDISPIVQADDLVAV